MSAARLIESFTCWLVLLIFNSIFFGAAVARAVAGQPSWYDICGSLTLCASGIYVVRDMYSRAAAASTEKGEK